MQAHRSFYEKSDRFKSHQESPADVFGIGLYHGFSPWKEIFSFVCTYRIENALHLSAKNVLGPTLSVGFA